MTITRDGKEYALTNDELLEARDELQRTHYIWEIDDYIADSYWSYLIERIPDEHIKEYVELIEMMADNCMEHEYNFYYCSQEYIHDLVDEYIGEFLKDIGLKFEGDDDE